MIYDALANIGRYLGIDGNLDQAIDSLRKLNLETLDAPRMELGNGNYLMVQAPTLKNKADTLWEAHRRYADIQIGLTPGESIEYLPTGAVSGWDALDADRDVMFAHDDAAGISLPMEPGCFALFFPEDAHRPCCGEGQTRKIVVKVLLTLQNC